MSLRDLFSPELGSPLWIFQVVEDMVITEVTLVSEMLFLPQEFSRCVLRCFQRQNGAWKESLVEYRREPLPTDNLHLGFQLAFPVLGSNLVPGRMASAIVP